MSKEYIIEDTEITNTTTAYDINVDRRIIFIYERYETMKALISLKKRRKERKKTWKDQGDNVCVAATRS